MLTRTGYVLKKSADQTFDVFELKKTLTVRPIENAVGITPPAFKVFKETKDHLCVRELQSIRVCTEGTP